MNQEFVPFGRSATPTAPQDGFRVKVLTQAPSKAAFSPANPAAGPTTTPTREPQITLERDGDRVTLIRIQCSCGQLIELGCVYG